jgi:hypothetical protein
MLAVALATVALTVLPLRLAAQGAPAPATNASQRENVPTASPAPPPSGEIFPLSHVRKGMTATAWTVFTGTSPEPMEVEILGVLRGARGPGQDLILAQLHGAKPDYTGVVEGMSGSPVYIGNKLLGSLSYRIGQFSKDAIAGITPIEQMLEVRDLPIAGNLERASTGPGAGLGLARPGSDSAASTSAMSGDSLSADGMNFQAIETPLVMSGFQPDAIRLWQQQMTGTSLASVAAGGMSGTSDSDTKPSAAAQATIVPGSAISEQLVRGDVEIAATCTVTYIDSKQLLACGHPVLQAGPVSVPMTTAEVVATLASPMNAFKIINTGATVGAFTEDRESGVRGVLGAVARMIPMHVSVDGPDIHRKVSVEILDLPSLTSQAVLVVLYDALLQANESTADTSYHVTGSIDLADYPPSPLDLWASAGDQMPAPMEAAFLTGDRFTRLYQNEARQGTVREINLHVEAIPRRLQVELVSARLVSNDMVHAGDTVMVEATVRSWQQPERNVRIPIQLPARLSAGSLRVLVSDGSTLDRTLDQPKATNRNADLQTVLAQNIRQHPADRIYVSLLAPEAQAGMAGQTLTSLPLSVANALEPVRTTQDINLNGESAEMAGDAPAGGVLSGFQILNVYVQPGGGLE